MLRRPGGFGPDGHPEDASLHAWMKGELDGGEGAGITAHLSSCDACQARIAKMEPLLEGLEAEQQADLDDLSWQRIAQAVKRELDSPKRPSLPSPGAFWTQRWVSAVAVTAAVVMLFVWGSPPLKLGQVAKESPPGATLVSAERGYAVRLPSGVDLTLASDTRVRLGRSEAAPNLYLEVGEVELLLPEAIELPAGGFEVRAPAFRVSARAAQLRVGYWAREYFVEVEKGEAKLRPEGQLDSITVSAGERRTVHLVGGPTASRAPERRANHPTPAASPRVEPSAVPPPSIASAPRAAAEPAPEVSRALEEETRVEVIAPPSDPLRDKLLEANRAFYEERNAKRAVELATEVAKTDEPRPEIRLAYGLICEAELALRRPERAAAACEAQLLREPDPESMRELHLKVGSILRSMLGRCEEAIHHYSEAMVFGRVSLLDAEARLGRASCALEIGDLELAERDLDLLSTAPGLHATRVRELINRLESLRKSGPSEMDRRDE